jgi:hypothetical protein
MTKSELIERLALRYPEMAAKDVDIAVKMILNTMCSGLMHGQRIEARGFGSCQSQLHLHFVTGGDSYCANKYLDLLFFARYIVSSALLTNISAVLPSRG